MSTLIDHHWCFNAICAHCFHVSSWRGHSACTTSCVCHIINELMIFSGTKTKGRCNSPMYVSLFILTEAYFKRVCSMTIWIFFFFGSAGIVIEEKNWPPFFPIIHHDIAKEIPIHLQRVQYVAFTTYLGMFEYLVLDTTCW